MALTAGTGAAPARDDGAAAADAWHKQRITRLTSEDGWLTLAGLHWFRPGTQSAGSAESNDIVMATGMPARIGNFELEGGKVTFRADPAAGITGADRKPVGTVAMVSDADGPPTVLRAGTFSFHVIKRGEKLGIRVKDSAASTRTGFTGIDRFPYAARWTVKARWEPFADARKMGVPNVLGAVEDMDTPGVAVFTVDGKEHRLQPVIEPGDNQLFFIFADATNKDATYGAGRFLYADLPKDGVVTLDFNRAYNPPCAFTSYATCPIPPPQNRLPVRVEAGEKRYGKAH